MEFTQSIYNRDQWHLSTRIKSHHADFASSAHCQSLLPLSLPRWQKSNAQSTWKELSQKSLQECVKEQQKSAVFMARKVLALPIACPESSSEGTAGIWLTDWKIRVTPRIEGTGWVSGRSGTRIGVSTFWAVKLSCPPSLTCAPMKKKTWNEVGSLKKKVIFEFLQASPLKHNMGLETSFKNNINKLFCRRIIYQEKR